MANSTGPGHDPGSASLSDSTADWGKCFAAGVGADRRGSACACASGEFYDGVSDSCGEFSARAEWDAAAGDPGDGRMRSADGVSCAEVRAGEDLPVPDVSWGSVLAVCDAICVALSLSAG